MKVYNSEFGVGNLSLMENTFTRENGTVIPMPWVSVDGIDQITLITDDAKTYLFVRLENLKR